jgi:hypothetical protein
MPSFRCLFGPRLNKRTIIHSTHETATKAEPLEEKRTCLWEPSGQPKETLISQSPPKYDRKNGQHEQELDSGIKENATSTQAIRLNPKNVRSCKDPSGSKSSVGTIDEQAIEIDSSHASPRQDAALLRSLAFTRKSTISKKRKKLTKTPPDLDGLFKTGQKLQYELREDEKVYTEVGGRKVHFMSYGKLISDEKSAKNRERISRGFKDECVGLSYESLAFGGLEGAAGRLLEDKHRQSLGATQNCMKPASSSSKAWWEEDKSILQSNKKPNLKLALDIPPQRLSAPLVPAKVAQAQIQYTTCASANNKARREDGIRRTPLNKISKPEHLIKNHYLPLPSANMGYSPHASWPLPSTGPPIEQFASKKLPSPPIPKMSPHRILGCVGIVHDDSNNPNFRTYQQATNSSPKVQINDNIIIQDVFRNSEESKIQSLKGLDADQCQRSLQNALFGHNSPTESSSFIVVKSRALSGNHQASMDICDCCNSTTCRNTPQPLFSREKTPTDSNQSDVFGLNDSQSLFNFKASYPNNPQPSYIARKHHYDSQISVIKGTGNRLLSKALHSNSSKPGINLNPKISEVCTIGARQDQCRCSLPTSLETPPETSRQFAISPSTADSGSPPLSASNSTTSSGCERWFDAPEGRAHSPLTSPRATFQPSTINRPTIPLSPSTTTNSSSAASTLILSASSSFICATCKISVPTFAFLSTAPSKSCAHPPITCMECIERWIRTGIEKANGNQYLKCPICEGLLGFKDVKNWLPEKT